MAFDQGYADALAEIETLRQELAEANRRIEHHQTDQIRLHHDQLHRLQRDLAAVQDERDRLREAATRVVQLANRGGSDFAIGAAIAEFDPLLRGGGQ
jgi:DNA repair exonuclease SbcCD ATPase subunit